jgi:hypothetical protein
MGEIMDALCLTGFFALIGGGIFGGGILGFRFLQSFQQSTTTYETNLADMNMTYQQTLKEISENLTIYEASFIEHEPYIISTNSSDFLGLCQKWNKTSVLCDSFRLRHTGFLTLVTTYSGYFWFDFNDNGIDVQVRLQFKV